MSTKLKAGTATSGAVLEADTAGILEIQTGSSPTTAITVDASQNVGIGTGSPSASAKLTLAGTNTNDALLLYNNSQSLNTGLVGSVAALTGSGTNNDLAIAAFNSTQNMVFWTNAGERMRIDSSGNLNIGTTSAVGACKTSIAFDGTAINGLAVQTTTAAGSWDAVKFLNQSTLVGRINATTSATSYLTSSDYRLKEEIAPMTGALDKVQALKPVTYKWKLDGSAGQGFIAHELAEIVPDCVVGAKDAVDEEGNPIYQGIDTSFLVATLVSAIQELKAKVTALEEQVINLGAK